MRRYGPPSADPIKIRISILDKDTGKIFLLKSPPNTHDEEGIEAGVVGGDSHFQAVRACLIKYPIVELYVYVWILAKVGVSIRVMILWLWSATLDVLGHLPP